MEKENNEEKIHYEYFRSIGLKVVGGKEFFVGFVTIIKSEVLYSTTLKQKYTQPIETVDFSITEFVENVHPCIRKLPTGDVSYELDESTYSLLHELASKDEVSFWIYLSVFSNNSTKLAKP